MNKIQLSDVAERAVWTGLQVVGADAIVQFFNLDPKYIVPIAFLLAVIKSALATKFGNGTASTLPASIEPLPATVSSDGAAAVVTSLPEVDPNVSSA